MWLYALLASSLCLTEGKADYISVCLHKVLYFKEAQDAGSILTDLIHIHFKHTWAHCFQSPTLDYVTVQQSINHVSQWNTLPLSTPMQGSLNAFMCLVQQENKCLCERPMDLISSNQCYHVTHTLKFTGKTSEMGGMDPACCWYNTCSHRLCKMGHGAHITSFGFGDGS